MHRLKYGVQAGITGAGLLGRLLQETVHGPVVPLPVLKSSGLDGNEHVLEMFSVSLRITKV